MKTSVMIRRTEYQRKSPRTVSDENEHDGMPLKVVCYVLSELDESESKEKGFEDK